MAHESEDRASWLRRLRPIHFGIRDGQDLYLYRAAFWSSRMTLLLRADGRLRTSSYLLEFTSDLRVAAP